MRFVDRWRPARLRRTIRIVASAAFAAVLGGLLVGMAVPRVVADIMLAPQDDVISRLEEGRQVSTAELAMASMALKRALVVRESGPAWTALGAVFVERARRLDAMQPGHDVFLDRGIRALERSLAIAPAQPFAWTTLAQAALARHGVSPEVVLPLGMAVRTGPASPRLIMIRLEVGLMAWPALDDETRELVAEQIRMAADHAPAALARLARQRYLLRPIRDVLAGDPTRLRRFDTVYLTAD